MNYPILKSSFLFILILFSFQTSFAQNEIKAKIEFEEAEQFLGQNKYKEALNHVEKAESLIGLWTPKTSYLRLEALNQLADLDDLDNEYTQKLIKEVKLYLDYFSKNEQEVVTEKFKLAYKIDEDLKEAKRFWDEKHAPDFVAGERAYDAKDYSKVLELWQKEAGKNNGEAMCSIGHLYYHGLGVTKDILKALEWYQKSADNGNKAAMFSIGVLYHEGLGVTQDYLKAMEWWQKSADKGDESAMFSIGGLYYSGKGVTQDYSRAMEWWQKSARKGHRRAMTNIGSCYANGSGVEQDFQKAIECYKLASDMGEVEAMLSIGDIYRYGYVAGGNNKAMDWYLKAVKEGNSIAMVAVGDLYGHSYKSNVNYSPKQDYTKAAEWYEKAAAKGNKDAYNLLIALYQNGADGIRKDKKKAEELRIKANAMP